jgi:GNAT superfamily N-acetyltransferase
VSKGAVDLSLRIRPYRPADQQDVLELLTLSLGGGPQGRRLPEFFQWKHTDNPFGPSFMLVGEADGRIVGLRAFMRWRFRAGERTVEAVRAVDTATHPDYQGRGVFTRLTREALAALEQDVDLVFNTPNEKSLPGYMKMGWLVVGQVPVSIRVRRPLRFARGARSAAATAEGELAPPRIGAPHVAEILGHASSVGLLLEESDAWDPRLRTLRDVEYLRWRYGAAPFLDYRAVAAERGGRLRGLAIFRVRPRGQLWETTIAELIVPRDDHRTSRRLLGTIVASAHVDHVTCHFPPGSAPGRAALTKGFIRAPFGMTFVAKPLRAAIVPAPDELRSWALSLGDLEVF